MLYFSNGSEVKQFLGDNSQNLHLSYLDISATEVPKIEELATYSETWHSDYYQVL